MRSDDYESESESDDSECIFFGISLPKKFVFITLAFKHLYLYINR